MWFLSNTVYKVAIKIWQTYAENEGLRNSAGECELARERVIEYCRV